MQKNRMSKNIVFEGWLTKSPPSKRIWKTKWRRRWFSLRQSGELPGQYFLDYFADRNCRQLKGTINLDFCEQVDAGLHMERGSHGNIDPKLRGSVFTIQTQTRTYHLEADCEAEMEKWVDAICGVCGLKATEETSGTSGIYQNHAMALGGPEKIAVRVVSKKKPRKVVSGRAVGNTNYSKIGNKNMPHRAASTNVKSNSRTITSQRSESGESIGPYIPISECITGARAQNVQNAFTFDPKNIVTSIKSCFEKTEKPKKPVRLIAPQIWINDVDINEMQSNFCEHDFSSFTTFDDWTLPNDFGRLSLAPQRIPSEPGPPVPPRPPKSFAYSKDISQKELLRAPKIQKKAPQMQYLQVPGRRVLGSPLPTRSCSVMSPAPVLTDDEDEGPSVNSMQYCNISVPLPLPSPVPPPVDRSLKPKLPPSLLGTCTSASISSSTCTSTIVEANIGPANSYVHVRLPEPVVMNYEAKLQYLDLDLPSPSSDGRSSTFESLRKSDDEESAYKTVDFVKTEAFNITRQDAEASRSTQQ